MENEHKIYMQVIVTHNRDQMSFSILDEVIQHFVPLIELCLVIDFAEPDWKLLMLEITNCQYPSIQD